MWLSTYILRLRKAWVMALCGLNLSLVAQELPKQLFGSTSRDKMMLWVDSVYQHLSWEERIAQLIMPIVYPSSDPANIHKEVERMRLYAWGGILYQRGLLEEQVAMNTELQSQSKVPLLIALDGEWGLYMRLKDAPRYPRNFGLGLSGDDQAVYNYGREVARQCRLMGIHINFAPTVDVNSNPQNPVIGTRSFGTTAQHVSKMSLAYALGLEDGGVLSVAKHFPGHGDTSEDSHKTLPLVSASRSRLNKVELIPFKTYISTGLGGIMTAHLRIPALDPSGRPSSLSRAITTDLLQGKLGFGGLIFTDGLEMQGVRKGYKGDVGLAALEAGNDILLGPLHPERQLNSLIQAYKQGALSQSLIEKKAKKVLCYKYRLIVVQDDLRKSREDIKQAIWTKATKEGQRLLWQKSLYYLKSPSSHLVDLKLGRYQRIAIVHYGKSFALPKVFDRAKLGESLTEDLTWEDFVKRAKDFDFAIVQTTQSQVPYEDLSRINRHCPCALVYYRSSLHVQKQEWMKSLACVLLATEATIEAKEAVYRELFEVGLVSQDPPTAKPNLREQALPEHQDKSDDDPTAQMSMATGKCTEEQERTDTQKGVALVPLSGRSWRPINRELLTLSVDSIIGEAIRLGAFPGCQIYVMQAGEELLNKSYGTLRGATSAEVRLHTLYDIASVSKALATAPALMLLVADGKVGLANRVERYLPELRGTVAGRSTLRELLLHESGLPPGLPFMQKLLSGAKDSKGHSYLSEVPSKKYSLRLAPSLYLNPSYQREMLRMIAGSKVRKRGVPLYSDLNYILLGWIVERTARESLENLLMRRLWTPLGAKLYYNPLLRGVPLDSIAPTQTQDKLRKSLIHGTVDDESAACLAGIAGNAGVFASARELAKLAQLLLDKGAYRAEQLLPRAVVEQFFSSQGVEGRRSLGFVCPRVGHQNNQAGEGASPLARGHYGFTGSAVWIDPQDKLVFVFLSNRTYTGRDNTLISRERYRQRLHQALYDAM